jgi:demethylmenaquinone methyltransferase/2-methoxy-6-polyprenyl-1,4-benzoquinol methylase
MSYNQESIKPYSDGEKGEQVKQMFDNIAPTYDQLNHRLSWNIDRYWRRKAIEKLKPFQPQHILDIATGTGDFAIESARLLHPARLTGSDISEGMMDIGRKKVHNTGLDDIIVFEYGDCMQLTYDDNRFDAVTCAFGIRNFPDLELGLSEMCRVLQPGGHMCVLELTMPVRFPMKQLFKLYARTVLPVYGRLVSKDTHAYDYLRRTIEAFPQGEVMAELLKKVGFREASFKRLTFGICTMYFATK